MVTVFVSYSAKDRDFVKAEIVAVLQASGITPWFSTDDIRSADDWQGRILSALRSCDWFLVAMSPNSASSEWVRNEVTWAMKNRRGRVLPVFIGDCDPDDFHLGLRRLQYVDLRQPTTAARQKLTETFVVGGGASTESSDESFSVSAPNEQHELPPPYFPFHCGPWVPPEFFIGRYQELQRARRLLETRQSFLVVGRPRAGKTSFFRRIISDLSNAAHSDDAAHATDVPDHLARPDARPLTSYMNLEQGTELTIERFLGDTILGIIGEMARALFKCGYSDLMREEPEKACPHLAEFSDFPLFLNIFRIVYRYTHQQNASGIDPLPSYDFVRLTKELLEICAEKGRSQFVVFYDEANRLRRDISVDLLNNIGEALSQTNVTGVYATSPEMARELHQLRGLAGASIELSAFRSPADMRRLLSRYYFRDAASAGELPVTALGLSDLWDLSHGIPYALQLISRRMFEIAEDERASHVDRHHVRAAWQEIARESPEIFE